MQTLLFSLKGLLLLAVEVFRALKYIVMQLATRFGLDQTVEKLVYEWNQLELCAQAADALYAFQDYLVVESANRQKRLRVFKRRIEIERRPVVEPKKVPRDLSFLHGLAIFPSLRMPEEKPIEIAPPPVLEPEKPSEKREEPKEEKKEEKKVAVPSTRPPYQKFPLYTEQELYQALEHQTKQLKSNETLKTYVKMSADNTAIEIHVEIHRTEEAAPVRESADRPKELMNEVLKLTELIE